MNYYNTKILVTPDATSKDLELAKELCDEYETQNSYVNVMRGFCHIESQYLADWLHNQGYIMSKDFIVETGYFRIDKPEDLPLTLQDLNSPEYTEFMDLYEDECDFYTPWELSICIYDYILNYTNEQRIDDFYYMNHSWVNFRGVIIDLTQEQFWQALDVAPTYKNYSRDGVMT